MTDEADSGVPELTRAHIKRLRWLFTLGRPASVADLSGIDLDLICRGLVAKSSDGGMGSGYSRLSLTPEAMMLLHDRRLTRSASLKPHASLADRLARHLEGQGMLTLQNAQFSNPLGPGEGRSGVVRPDVIAVSGEMLIAQSAKSAVYEIKTSRADFKAERPEKTAAYQALAQAVYFCCVDGLIEPAELPADIGLICEVEQGGGRSFAIRKPARRRKGFVMPPNVYQTMLVKQARQHEALVDEMGMRLQALQAQLGARQT